ncbi:alkaline protease [Deinococcus sp. Arct2-2]|nr:alkaline protease [Deinococcus sp. Arct2-2]
MMVTGVNALQPQALSPRQWFWPRLGIPEAWTRSQGAGITVAVIDTGVALTHPDLQANLWPGRDYVDGDKTPSDVGGHGTHVSGLIAANGLVSGAAPQAHLLPVRVIGPAGGTTSDLARGLIWAAGLDETDPNPHPAQVINLSLGTPEYSDVLTQAVKRVLDAGVIVVAANGNDGGLPYSPANIPGVIAVTSMGGPETLYQPSYANRGPGTRIAAYGGDLNADQDRDGEKDGILSTDLDGGGKPGYALRQGTSMAAPQVSGIAALLLSQGAPARTVKALLEGQATDLGVAGMDLNTGWGLVNALAVKADAPQTYAVALNTNNRVITYTRTLDNKFALHSLPPGQAVQVVAATDLDGDGIVGEAGELRSAAQPITVTPGGQATATLTLAPADGTGALTLPK